jgi:hypothetical protein
MKQLIFLLLCTTFIISNSHSQSHKIIESTSEYLKIEFNFENEYNIKEISAEGMKFHTVEGKEINVRKPGEPWLPDYRVNFGIPHNSNPVVKIINISQDKIQNIFILPTPDSLNQPLEMLPYEKEIYNRNNYFPVSSVEIDNDFVMRYIRIATLSIAPYQINPISRELIFNKRIVVQIDFKIDPLDNRVINLVKDKMTDDILRSSVINYDIARDFIGKPVSVSPESPGSYWYNPSKNYYKIYLNKKGVYRITYDMLINAGVPPGELHDMNFELFNNGESVPIDVVDLNQDNIFNEGDYFQFVGGPAKPADEYTRMNIYNTINVYWFSYQADSLNYYQYIDGFPVTSSPLISSSTETLRYEKDLNYQRFGHAPNSNRDYWMWGPAEARNRTPFRDFLFWIEDSITYYRNETKPDARIRVGLHGQTTNTCPAQNGHSATIRINGHTLGIKQWNGQESALFEKSFFIGTNHSGDTVGFQTNHRQLFAVFMFGDICEEYQNDYVWINYIELDYWRWNRTYYNHFFFTSPPGDFGENRYYLWRWLRDNMKIYIPGRGEVIPNPHILNSSDNAVVFTDTISVQTDYYCVADDYYLLPDSITYNSDPSDLRNNANGADYIIVTHSKFREAADRLADFRSSIVGGSYRVKIIEINSIYNEFSYGLLNPFALRDFAKYAFENWQEPAPSFIVLIGDASYDYRQIFPTNRKNYIPSVPFHDSIGNFGQLPSDNSIVMVEGNDTYPDIAIGRLSCESLEEANVLVDKIVNYPGDDTKPWKENVILLASGLNYDDQIRFGFNNAAKQLEGLHLLPNGINATKVFNFPEPPDIEFWGDGPRMRQEINKGAVAVSYYGHGGGSQWDLIFTKDDIPELNNGDRLPFISSITCFTAHFDNAESFGEVFTKIPNKGAIGFWGSVSLTWWPSGHNMNSQLFHRIFTNRNYVIGSSILGTLSVGNTLMIPQIAYLGDPALELAIPKAPDFEIKSSDITIFPEMPLKDDTVVVAINIRNWGVTFPNDSVVVELFKNTIDTTNLIGEIKLSSFGYNSIVNFNWVPGVAGLYNLIARVNEKDTIDELDHSDNIASRSFNIFDFGQPNIVKPVNGFYTNEDKIDFVLSDIGFYFDRDFNYIIQINTSPEFDDVPVLVQSPVLTPIDGIVKWKSGTLNSGEYFWRAVIYDPIDTNTSSVKIFSINSEAGNGYLAKSSQLQLFDLHNIDYSVELKSLILNTELKPPHPEDKFFLDSIMFSLPADSTEPSMFTVDGTYFYFGHLPIHNNNLKSKIYKIGTGLNGTIAGEHYGPIPNLEVFIYGSLMIYNGFLYTNTGSVNDLLRINPANGDTVRIELSDSLLLTVHSPTQIGGVYLYSDGEYVYNLGIGTSSYPEKLVLRTFDPSNWSKVGEDIIFSGTLERMRRVASFFVWGGYAIMYENFNTRYLRRYRLSDGVFEEEWAHFPPFTYSRKHYTVTYDFENDLVYFARFSPIISEYQPGFTKYSGTYIEAHGEITSQEIGPASKWYDLQFDIDQTNSNGTYKAFLTGKNVISDTWEVLDTLSQSGISLDNINVKDYNYLRMNFALVDSSFGGGEPLKFKSLKVNYEYLPEISMIPKEMTFAPDSMLQGFDVNMNLKVHNIGYINADSVRVDFYLNEGDTVLFSKYVSIAADTFNVIEHTFQTNRLIFDTDVKAIANSPVQEYFTFNNLIENSFYVARDSVKPVFTITFDGQEILDGDIVSAKPEVLITLEDNSPLPLDESHFTIVHNNNPLFFTPDTLEFNYTPYPNSKALIKWSPDLTDGRHTLQILAKDASGNFFDTTSYIINFFVYNESDIVDVYNYPNPFTNDTHFTFELRGSSIPDELRIRIFTVAGRLIKEINIPPEAFQNNPAGFKKIHWDGKDQDGNEIANGLYFYKLIYKNDDVIKTVTQKLAKVK